MRYPSATVLALLLLSGCYQARLTDVISATPRDAHSPEILSRELSVHEARYVLHAPADNFVVNLLPIPAGLRKITFVLKNREALNLIITDAATGGANWWILFYEQSAPPAFPGVTVTRKGEDFEVVVVGAAIDLLRHGGQVNFYGDLHLPRSV